MHIFGNFCLLSDIEPFLKNKKQKTEGEKKETRQKMKKQLRMLNKQRSLPAKSQFVAENVESGKPANQDSHSSVQFSQVQDGIYALGKAYMRSIPSIRSFPQCCP